MKFRNLVLKLHSCYFIGKVGMVIVGITGVLLLLMAITGAILWTGWRKLTTGFKIRWNTPLALVSYDIHLMPNVLLITGMITWQRRRCLLRATPTLIAKQG